MIIHKIDAYPEPPLSRKERKKQKHRETIFSRTKEKLGDKFSLGETYLVKNTGETGTLIYIYDDLKEVLWDGMKVKFLELWFADSQLTDLYHPSDLEKCSYV